MSLHMDFFFLEGIPYSLLTYVLLLQLLSHFGLFLEIWYLNPLPTAQILFVSAQFFKFNSQRLHSQREGTEVSGVVRNLSLILPM